MIFIDGVAVETMRISSFNGGTIFYQSFLKFFPPIAIRKHGLVVKNFDWFTRSLQGLTLTIP